jgi:MoaA/NifB/PqqE/SkfB family radical SAM enzyme
MVSGMNSESATFCMHPFTGLATREDGAVKVCCRSHPIGYIQDQTLEEIWNNDTMRRIRQQVLSDQEPPECAPCFNLERQGVESLRQRHITGVIPEARIKLYPNALQTMQPDFTMPFEIPTMEIKMNNLCNLKCRMCNPMDSTSWNDWQQVVPFYRREDNFLVKKIDDLNLMRKPFLDSFIDTDNWWASFEKLLPFFRRVEFAGGEPLMDPTHYKILDMLSVYGHQIEIKYATNLTMLGKGDRTVWQYWPKFKSVAVNVSIDGIGPSYEYVRGNADWDTVIDNIKQIQTIPNISRIVGAVAVQVSNILILDQMIEYFLDDLGIVFYTNMVNYPNALSAQTLPPELCKLAINRLKAARLKVPTYKLAQAHPILVNITNGQIDGVINYLESNTQHHLWSETIAFNRALDETRAGLVFEKVTPEFKDYV